MAKHKNLPSATFYLRIPAEAGAEGNADGWPEQSERVSTAHNPKCRDQQDYKDFSFLDLRVKPEDDREE